MEEGEKYLTIQLLGGSIKVAAFKNEHRKENKNAPHYKGDGVAVWINTKRIEEKKIPEEDIL